MCTFQDRKFLYFPPQDGLVQEFYHFNCDISQEELTTLSILLNTKIIDLDEFKQIFPGVVHTKLKLVAKNARFFLISKEKGEFVIFCTIPNSFMIGKELVDFCFSTREEIKKFRMRGFLSIRLLHLRCSMVYGNINKYFKSFIWFEESLPLEEDVEQDQIFPK